MQKAGRLRVRLQLVEKVFSPSYASFSELQTLQKNFDYARKTALMVFFCNYLSFRRLRSLRFFDSLSRALPL